MLLRGLWGMIGWMGGGTDVGGPRRAFLCLNLSFWVDVLLMGRSTRCLARLGMTLNGISYDDTEYGVVVVGVRLGNLHDDDDVFHLSYPSSFTLDVGKTWIVWGGMRRLAV
jgi:hypothetical protein